MIEIASRLGSKEFLVEKTSPFSVNMEALKRCHAK